jgi:hypothetical protein
MKGNEKEFTNFLLPCQDAGYKSTTIFSVINSFGCTFHLSIEFFSEVEIIDRAQDWIRIVENSIINGEPDLRDNDAHLFLKESFKALFPTLAPAVLAEVENVENLPSRAVLQSALSDLAKT